jgi:predicted amino acid racemase
MLFEGRLPSGVNHMRLGSAMLRGAIAWEPIERLRHDTLEFSAAWAEIARKPSKPWGVQALDAFGHTPHFDDIGCRLRGILAAGRQDVYPEGLRPSDPGIKILGASSDHLVCDIEDMLSVPDIGDQAIFQVSYAAMMTASTSEYVEKIFC